MTKYISLNSESNDKGWKHWKDTNHSWSVYSNISATVLHVPDQKIKISNDQAHHHTTKSLPYWLERQYVHVESLSHHPVVKIIKALSLLKIHISEKL